MMTFLKEFMAFYRSRGKSVRPVVWDDGDSQSVAKFLDSQAGKRLMHALDMQAQEQDRQAVVSGDRGQCGVAMGFRIALALFKQFSESVPTDGNDTGKSRADLLRERVSP